MAIKTVLQSVIVSMPIVIHTETIIATDATFTASRKIESLTEDLIFFNNVSNKATKIKAGKKIPIVAMIAPDQPFI